MSDVTAEGKAAEAPAELRGTLIARLAVAGGLVAVLLGVLAFFDYLASSEEPEAVVYTKPVPVQAKKEVTQPVTPAVLSEPTETEEAAAPVAEPLPKSDQTVQAAAPTPVARPQPTKGAVPARPAPEITAAPAPASVRISDAPAATSQPPAPRLFSGYVLRAGVFSNAKRAEELHAKLTLNGIPSTMEARVQVGPFKSREEAEAAREKMLSLGIDPVLIPPRMGKR